MDRFQTKRNGTGESCMIDKQQVSQRKYSPELRSIPLTWMDCPYNGYNIDLHDKLNDIHSTCYYCVYYGYADGTKQDDPTACDVYTRFKKCPMGYVR